MLLPRNGDFTVMPTLSWRLHIRVEGDEAVITCSPCREIAVFSDAVWVDKRMIEGENLQTVRVPVVKYEHFVRARVTDADGRQAWTNCVPLPR